MIVIINAFLELFAWFCALSLVSNMFWYMIKGHAILSSETSIYIAVLGTIAVFAQMVPR